VWHLDVQKDHFGRKVLDQLVRLRSATRCLDDLKMRTMLLDLTANGLTCVHLIINNEAPNGLIVLIHLYSFLPQINESH
jgi:hypothetical protein